MAHTYIEPFFVDLATIQVYVAAFPQTGQVTIGQNEREALKVRIRVKAI